LTLHHVKKLPYKGGILSRIVTLRIKKVYLEDIVRGVKDREYRDYKDYYHKTFRGEVSHLVLHYQKGVKVKVKVKSIRVVPTPLSIQGRGVPFGGKVYEIKLGEVISHNCRL
jgi:hypothetical protein